MAEEIDFGRYPVWRFEQTYGLSNFCFEYVGCLFIGLRNDSKWHSSLFISLQQIEYQLR